ncbi:hypothetical protein UP10_01315 [Bradyrhizobium sp. LTSPM299]|uniref:hypothetical protein n=1 Tax=Bradyrhizobium sp. LTSPM299 TaxID=1619233 RepID=UPI0005CB2C6D|nr:hypothetical protein [Bradyrhizobium sp. LTSPM299]KJC62056.1 hypothetical protein UP10_01315 [Bradyrhizobium sp. LTSPM299]
MAPEIQFELFANGSPIGKDLVRHWHRRAKSAGERQDYDSFDAFTRLWTGFNQWGMRVTEVDTDAEMIRKLAESPALSRAFTELLERDVPSLTYAKVFAAFWPIFNVKDIRKKRLREQFLGLDRPEYIRWMRGRHVQHQPQGNFDREKPSWSQTIRAIYQVRCNLLHGEKGDSSEDYRIVEGAYRILLSFIDGVELYRWPQAASGATA